MQSFHMRDSNLSSASSMASLTGCQSWGNAVASHVQEPSLSKSLQPNFQSTKLLSFQGQYRDSSSTQSMGQSSPEVTYKTESNGGEQSKLSAQSGAKEFFGSSIGNNMKLPSSGVWDSASAPLQVDYSPSLALFPFPSAEGFYSGVLAASYGSQTLVRWPQIMALESARVPLPPNFPQDKPVFVNAKQYDAILRRRQHRARLQAENKLIKARKPYLHESRHLHAVQRTRGAGGRFINTKKLQESKPDLTSEKQHFCGSPRLPPSGSPSESKLCNPDSYKDSGSATSCSDVTSASNSDDIFQQPEVGFSGSMRGVGDTNYLAILQ